jgi:hypothetical protein
MTKMYRVTAPYVTARITAATGGETVLGFYESGVLPDTAMQESIDSLLAKGMIEELDSAEVKVIEKADAEAEKAEAAAAKQRADEAEADRTAAEKEAKAAADAEAKAAKSTAKPAAK